MQNLILITQNPKSTEREGVPASRATRWCLHSSAGPQTAHENWERACETQSSGHCRGAQARAQDAVASRGVDHWSTRTQAELTGTGQPAVTEERERAGLPHRQVGESVLGGSPWGQTVSRGAVWKWKTNFIATQGRPPRELGAERGEGPLEDTVPHRRGAAAAEAGAVVAWRSPGPPCHKAPGALGRM